jgi:alpha-tubulin suppressor-like RCC1 family protein
VRRRPSASWLVFAPLVSLVACNAIFGIDDHYLVDAPDDSGDASADAPRDTDATSPADASQDADATSPADASHDADATSPADAPSDSDATSLTDAPGDASDAPGDSDSASDAGDAIAPTDAADASASIVLALGNQHSCARLPTGVVKCWGINASEQIGVPGVDASAPVVVLDHATLLSSGPTADHECAELQDGAVACWGANQWQQTGLEADASDSNGNVDRPTVVPWMPSFRTLATGEWSTCGEASDGGVSCWGNWISNHASLPEQHIDGLLAPVSSLAAGAFLFCAVHGDASAACWGTNQFGGLANSDASTSASAVTIPNDGDGTPVVQVVVGAGDGHACALRKSGQVTCWGANKQGQTGHAIDAGDPIMTPVIVPSLPAGILQISAGEGFTCARTAHGVWCWGQNDHAQCGQDSPNPDPILSPTEIVDLQGQDITALHSADAHSCVVIAGTSVQCWGINLDGELGTGTAGGNSAKPVSPLLF